MDIEENTSSKNLKDIDEGLDMSVFGIFKYYIRSESGRMIALQSQTYYVLGILKSLRIISPKGICTS